MIGGRKTRSNKGSKRAPYKMSGKPRKTRSNKGVRGTRAPYKMSKKTRKTRSNKGVSRGPRGPRSVKRNNMAVVQRRSTRTRKAPKRLGF
jgi:hypothetical protein